MKKYLILLLLLSSCYYSVSVKLRNGSVVKAFETDGREFNVNDTICVFHDVGRWVIDSHGLMVDSGDYRVGTVFKDHKL